MWTEVQDFETDEFVPLQLFAIHLVWYLHSVGQMPTETANVYLGDWKGVRADVRRSQILLRRPAS